MKDVFLNKIKKILNEEKESLLLKQQQDVDIDLSGDEVDAIQGKILANVQAQLSSRNVTKLKAIEAAFVKIEEGSFGLCEECGDKIADKRLLFNPMFINCISCAEQLELERKHHRQG